jgi:hypothetical protein
MEASSSTFWQLTWDLVSASVLREALTLSDSVLKICNIYINIVTC